MSLSHRRGGERAERQTMSTDGGGCNEWPRLPIISTYAYAPPTSRRITFLKMNLLISPPPLPSDSLSYRRILMRVITSALPGWLIGAH